jgi:probable F420-dependent oxidoreductase
MLSFSPTTDRTLRQAACVPHTIRAVKLGVIVSPAAGWTYLELCDLARDTERAGFDSFWVSDHFFGGAGFPDRDCLEAWTLLAALARDTEHVRLGCLVTAAQYRNPALLAKIVAGVDQMSDGRIEFGIGAGWKESEYRAYGYEYLEPGPRVEQMIEAIEICKRLWTEERATFRGKHYRVEEAVCAPKPKQRPYPPVWIGGNKPRVMRVAARMADGFDIGRRGADGAPLTGEEMRSLVAELDAACVAVGRTRPLRKSHWSPIELEADAASVRALRERIVEYESAGLERLILAFPKERAGEMVRRAHEEGLTTRPSP